MAGTRTQAQLARETELCLRLHSEERTVRDIADTMRTQGIKMHYSTVQRRIAWALNHIVMPNLDDARKQELLRLDALINTYGPMAADGGHKAADIVLKAVASRSRIIGLENKNQAPTPAPEPARPVIDATVIAAAKAALANPIPSITSMQTNDRPNADGHHT